MKQTIEIHQMLNNTGFIPWAEILKKIVKGNFYDLFGTLWSTN